MKVILLAFVFSILHVSFAKDGAGPSPFKNVQPRPLHKPETQNNPVIVPVPVYTPVQQYPIQQYPPIQQFPAQQHPPIQQVPVQQHPIHQYVPVQQVPIHYPQYQVQHYPQMLHPHHHTPHYYPQYSHGIPC